MLKKLMTILSLTLITSTVLAVSLQNRDSKSYNVKVKGSPSNVSTSISGGTIKGTICSRCTITVDGVGKIDASGSDKVVIKGGKLSK